MRKNKQPAALLSRKAIVQQHIHFICHNLGKVLRTCSALWKPQRLITAMAMLLIFGKVAWGQNNYVLSNRLASDYPGLSIITSAEIKESFLSLIDEANAAGGGTVLIDGLPVGKSCKKNTCITDPTDVANIDNDTKHLYFQPIHLNDKHNIIIQIDAGVIIYNDLCFYDGNVFQGMQDPYLSYAELDALNAAASYELYKVARYIGGDYGFRSCFYLQNFNKCSQFINYLQQDIFYSTNYCVPAMCKEPVSECSEYDRIVALLNALPNTCGAYQKPNPFPTIPDDTCLNYAGYGQFETVLADPNKTIESFNAYLDCVFSTYPNMNWYVLLNPEDCAADIYCTNGQCNPSTCDEDDGNDCIPCTDCPVVAMCQDGATGNTSTNCDGLAYINAIADTPEFPNFALRQLKKRYANYYYDRSELYPYMYGMDCLIAVEEKLDYLASPLHTHTDDVSPNAFDLTMSPLPILENFAYYDEENEIWHDVTDPYGNPITIDLNLIKEAIAKGCGTNMIDLANDIDNFPAIYNACWFVTDYTPFMNDYLVDNPDKCLPCAYMLSDCNNGLFHLVKCSHISFEGAGIGSSVIDMQRDLISIDASDFCENRFAFDIANECEYITIKNMTIRNLEGDAVWIAAINPDIIEKPYMPKHITIDNCHIFRAARTGIGASNVDDLNITNCIIEGTTGFSQGGIDLEPETDESDKIDNVTISNCIFKNNCLTQINLPISALRSKDEPYPLGNIFPLMITTTPLLI
ncbi:MAG: right-handed parallel beta-helix repeat-containing protein [Sphingobacteriales bacterium]|nr:right-handed parallel beta-helix repeat-containing protein [Sphingobacteriales bacterium]